MNSAYTKQSEWDKSYESCINLVPYPFIEHEQGILQLFFSLEKVFSLFEGVFELAERNLIRRANDF
jgi:hypothetical protein